MSPDTSATIVGALVGWVFWQFLWRWWSRQRPVPPMYVSQAWLANRRRVHGDEFIDHR